MTIDEILMGRANFLDLSEEIRKNLINLVKRINLFESFYHEKFKLNDGFRRLEDTPKNGSKKSKHLEGLAVDIDDDDKGALWQWIFDNRKLLAEIGLWVEHPCWTHCNGKSWIHLQIVPPNSGNRFFIPSSEPNPNPSFWDGKYENELNSKNQP